MDKTKRVRRFQQKKRHIDRQVEILRLHGFDNTRGQRHRLHKKAAMNCGIPSCPYCANPRKMLGHKTMQELKFEAAPVEV